MKGKIVEYQNFILKAENKIAVLSINRPAALNALSTALLVEFEQVLDHISKSNEISVLIITGEGRAFVAGADIEEMRNKSAAEARQFGDLGARVFRKIELLEIPVIAAVNGFALGGGCELAMSCDIRIAGDKARFGQPEVGLGITPGFSGTQRLPRIVGIAKAKELIFTAEIIKADEALNIGLVTKVVAQEELMNSALEMANKIAKNGQLAVRYSKAAINRGIETDIETGISIEKDLFALCFATADQKEGMSAFLEKRAPEFKGL